MSDFPTYMPGSLIHITSSFPCRPHIRKHVDYGWMFFCRTHGVARAAAPGWHSVLLDVQSHQAYYIVDEFYKSMKRINPQWNEVV